MVAFSLTKHPSLVIAHGASNSIGQHVADTVGSPAKVLLIADPALVELGLTSGIVQSIEAAGHALQIFTHLQSDPKESSVDEATKLAFENKVTCVVGLGGGSALDTAKVVAALAHSGEKCAPYRLAKKQLPFRKTGMIAIPTTAGTGSETTGTSIISEVDGTKNWFWGPPLKPDMALMDPNLTVGLPRFWTFYTGMDALVHSLEAVTNRYCFAENDRIGDLGIEFAFRNIAKVVNEPGNLEARHGMMLAAAYGGLAIGNTGTGLAHNIGHALGSIAGIPHGRAVSVSLATTLPWYVEGNRPAFDRVARIMGGTGADDIQPILHDIAAQCGESLSLSTEEKQAVEVETLATDMLADANIAMLEGTARDANEDDVRQLAEMTLAA